jgi:uncharacterized protein YjbI with pentapeptide repeats
MSNINNTNLTNVDLSGVTAFANANLAGAVLTGVTINYVTDLSNAILNGVISGGIVYVPVTSGIDAGPLLPPNWSILNGYLVGPGANLINADLEGEVFTNLRLFNADFTGANLTDAIFHNSALSKCNFSGADISGAKFTGANLHNTIFSSAVFSETTTFKNSTISSVAYTKSATLNGIMSGNIIDVNGAIFAYSSATNKLPANWSLINGYLVGPGANLTNADLN